MKSMRFFALLGLCAALVLAGPAARAEFINFDDQGLSGPSLFVDAGPAQTLNVSTSIGTVTFTGGVILTQTSFMPANQTSIYGTAYFGDVSLDNPLAIYFPSAISNFFLDVYNGLTTDIEYTVWDNQGHSAVFTLAPNLQGGTSQIGFAATGDTVYVGTSNPDYFDFFIDNIHFNEALPPDLNNVPVPAAVWLLGSGLVGLAGLRKKFLG